MSKKPRGPRVDGEATRVRILETAGEMFAASGFAETTSKAIAMQAEVDLASINYHFGSRNGLYQAVLVDAHRRLVDVADLQPLVQSAMPAADKLKALLNQLVAKTIDEKDGWHLSVLAAELLAPSSNLQVLFETEVPMKASLVIRILSEITGIPAGDPALMRCLLNVLAPCLLLLISRRGIAGPLLQIRRMPGEVLVEHLHLFAMGGLKAIAEDHARQA
jgi:TetR/AcrR family transcriptional regulator, regulator of cefoperazone and chloramphenicol sensitivity